MSHNKRAKQGLFHMGQSIYVKNFRGPPTWLLGRVTAALALLTFVVNVVDERTVHRHINHIRPHNDRANHPRTSLATEPASPTVGKITKSAASRRPREEGVPAQSETPSPIIPTRPVALSGRGEVVVVNAGEELTMEEPVEDMGCQGAEPLQLAHPHVWNPTVPGEATSVTTEQATAETHNRLAHEQCQTVSDGSSVQGGRSVVIWLRQDTIERAHCAYCGHSAGQTAGASFIFVWCLVHSSIFYVIRAIISLVIALAAASCIRVRNHITTATYKLIRSLVAPQKPTDKYYGELVEVLKIHSNLPPMIAVERFKFNSRMRQPSENIATYISELWQLTNKYNFGNSLDEMLREPPLYLRWIAWVKRS